MASPFAVFRKHQKIMLVVLVGLSMLSFVIFDAVQNVGDIGSMPPTLVVLAFAALIGAVAWVFGINNAKSSEYGSIGLIAGLAIGLLFVLRTRQSDSVTTGGLDLSRNQMIGLMNTRTTANRFVMQAVDKTAADPNSQEASFRARMSQFGFGFPEDRMEEDVILGELLRREADKIGLQLPDSAVLDYIKQLTNDRMTAEDFREIRQELGVSESELIASLKDELRARQAANLLYSRVDLPPAVDWEFSQQLQVRQTATTAAVPVSAFVNDKAEPPQAELEALFQEYRQNAPGQLPNGKPQEGRPGFYQPARIKLAYVTPDYQAFERQVEGSITDEMVAERYQRDYVDAPKKPASNIPSLFPDGQIPGLSLPGVNGPSLNPSGPMLAPPSPTEPPATTPATPEAAPPATPDAPPATPDAAVPPATAPESSTPAVPPATESAPPPATPDSPSPPAVEEKSNEGCDDPVAVPAAETPTGEAATPAPDAAAPPAADATPAPADATPAAVPPSATPPVNESPAGDTPAVPAPAGEPATPAAAAPPAAAPPVGDAAANDPFPVIPGETPPPVPSTPIPPLDDALKAEIREQLLAEKTAAAIEAAMAAAIEEIGNKIAINVHAQPGSPQLLTVDAATKLVEAYAAAHHFSYVQSDLMSYQELLKSDDYPVAQFKRPMPGSPFQTFTVADELFSSSKQDYFRPRQIEDRDAGGKVRDRAIYWKLAHEPGYVPESMSEERVRNNVVQTWRELQARKKAEERAKQIAELVRKSGKPMLEALADTTITGAPGSTLLSIMQTGQFAWMRQTIVPAMTLQGFDFAPVRSQIPGLEPVGDDFMRTVFRDLGPGDVGVAPSADRSVYYVVKIDTRIPATEEEWTIVRNNFLSGDEDSALDRLGNQLLSSEIPHWADELFRRYDVQLASRATE